MSPKAQAKNSAESPGKSGQLSNTKNIATSDADSPTRVKPFAREIDEAIVVESKNEKKEEKTP